MKRFTFGKVHKQILFIPAVGFVKLSNDFYFNNIISFTFLSFGFAFKYHTRENRYKGNRVPYNGKRLRIDINNSEFSLFPTFGMRFLPIRFNYKYSLCFAWGHLYICYKFGMRAGADLTLDAITKMLKSEVKTDE